MFEILSSLWFTLVLKPVYLRRAFKFAVGDEKKEETYHLGEKDNKTRLFRHYLDISLTKFQNQTKFKIIILLKFEFSFKSHIINYEYLLNTIK